MGKAGRDVGLGSAVGSVKLLGLREALVAGCGEAKQNFAEGDDGHESRKGMRRRKRDESECVPEAL